MTYNVYPVTPANTQKSAKVNEGLELEAFVKIKKRSPAGGGAKGTKIRKSSTQKFRRKSQIMAKIGHFIIGQNYT